ncbi:MAG: glycoside hydrolase 43 family protein [Acidimicrobiia bacterium]
MTGFTNPVIPGFHPDPSVCRVGDDYYLVTSTFTWAPGVPIFHSRNLVDWTQIANVLDRPSQLDLTATTGWASLGVYAPTIRHHDGVYYVATTNFTHGGAPTFFVTAEDPAGPWSDPVRVDVGGVDPDLAWDDEGRCWLHFSRSVDIARVEIDHRTGAVLDGPHATWTGTGLQYPEAPHLIRRGGWWYLLIAEGGTHAGHAVSVARGPSPEGPWEGCPDNPVLSHRSTAHPIQNTGHADLVEAPDGSWWMVLLGVRPKGGFHVLGRETFLAPVEWVDDWPVVGPLDLEMPRRPPGTETTATTDTASTHDDFDGLALDPRWVGVRRAPAALASLTARPGWLTLPGRTATLDDDFPVFVGRRQQHRHCRVRARLDPGSTAEAGLAVVMAHEAHIEIGVRGDEIVAHVRTTTISVEVGRAAAPTGPVTLVIETRPSILGPDLVALGFEAPDGTPTVVAEVDGRYCSTEVVLGFTGRVIGMYAVGGDAAFDWFAYEPLEHP